MDLFSLRICVADDIYSCYDFENLEVVDHSGWQCDGDDRLTRPVFLEASNHVDWPSIRCLFAVTFENASTTPIEINAYDQGGNIIGKMAPGDIEKFLAAP